MPLLSNQAGSSFMHERIELIQRYINLFGHQSIESLVADREFIGLCYLSGSRIRTKTGIEHQIVISYNAPERAHSTYKEQW